MSAGSDRDDYQQPHTSDPLQTLTSGRKRDVRGGSFQAHICCVGSHEEVKVVMQAFMQADAFKAVTSWSYAYRINVSASAAPVEGTEDGLDEGCGEKILNVLRRFSLQGLLLVISRWQDYGASSGLAIFGAELYGIVIERCKDLIAHLKQAVVPTETAVPKPVEKPHEPRSFDFSFLPPIQEPRAPAKFGPNHFLSDSALNRPASLPNLFTAGDVRLWMKNDQVLRNLPESELWALRFLRQPDFRIERVLQAVATLRGQKVPSAASTAAARWGHYREVLKSPTLRTELLLFDASSASAEAAQHALDLLMPLEETDIRRVSPGAAALFEWAIGVAKWRLQGPPMPSPGGQEWIPLEPLRPREAELRTSPRAATRRRPHSNLRTPKCFSSGTGVVMRQSLHCP